MLEAFETLAALVSEGTTQRAAVKLRITASTVSKRLSALEDRVGVSVVELEGRKLRLTLEGERLLREASPLLAALNDVLQPSGVEALPRVGVAESLLSSWAPEPVGRAGFSELHTHRGPRLVERLREGSLDIALCADPGSLPDLEAKVWKKEAMGLVGEIDEQVPIPIWTVEATSFTAAVVDRYLRKHPGGFTITGRLESEMALVRLAQAGLVRAVVAQGVAVALGASFQPLPGLFRSIVAVARPTTWRRPPILRWWTQLCVEMDLQNKVSM